MAQMNTQLAGHTAAIKAMGPAIEFLGKKAGYGAERPKFPIKSIGDLISIESLMAANGAFKAAVVRNLNSLY